MQIQESGEMYLETILMLSKRQEHVRAIDICDEMGYSKPSVSRAVGLLKSGGFITVNTSGHISLTECGLELAEKILDRHTVLTEMLVALGVERDIAVRDACKMEHAISDESFDAIKRHISEYGKK
ncbi:MAG: metal-dependent transcriptional regulator [Clostridia bacterium]|nr:metal-dependent transcriptional regulator [Clostridia bacterium]MBQ8289953.1 metal-dependent transcriptional regulator [Clostridia bacterium]